MTCVLRLSATAAHVLAIIVSFAAAAQATIIPVAYYRLGETDPGAVAGNIGNNPTDDATANSNDLARVSSPLYSSSVAASALATTGSTLSMDFGSSNSANYYNRTAGALATGATNFVMEGWFNLASTSGSPVLVLNGNGGSSGTAFILSGGTLNVLRPGIGFVSTGFTPTLNTWFYAALVKEASNVSVYINNNAPVLLGTFGFTAPSGFFTIGANGGGGLYMSGLADEVRISTIVNGTFNAATDLLINVPEPSSFAMLLFGSVMLWAVRRKRK